MKILIVCPRDYDDLYHLEHVLDEYLYLTKDQFELVSTDLGDATVLIENYAFSRKIKYTAFLPNWYRDGDQADVYVVNQMFDYCKGPRNVCIAFTREKTKYVNNMIRQATENRMSVLKIVR